MSLHLFYNHKCPSCHAAYFPYDDVPCPKCGKKEKERYDFVTAAIESMRLNKRMEGSYTPPAWALPSFGDRILLLLFNLFDDYEAQKSKQFKRFATRFLKGKDWKDKPYLHDHVLGIAVRIHEQMQREKRVIGKR